MNDGRTLHGGALELVLTSAGQELGALSPRLILVTAESDAAPIQLPDVGSVDGPERWIFMALGANGFEVRHGAIVLATLGAGDHVWIGACNGEWVVHRSNL